MNERIRELAEQCYHRYSEHNIDLEKFTTLLIKESIEVMMKHDYHGEWLGEKLKQHFGVNTEQ